MTLSSRTPKPILNRCRVAVKPSPSCAPGLVRVYLMVLFLLRAMAGAGSGSKAQHGTGAARLAMAAVCREWNVGGGCRREMLLGPSSSLAENQSRRLPACAALMCLGSLWALRVQPVEMQGCELSVRCCQPAALRLGRGGPPILNRQLPPSNPRAATAGDGDRNDRPPTIRGQITRRIQLQAASVVSRDGRRLASRASLFFFSLFSSQLPAPVLTDLPRLSHG